MMKKLKLCFLAPANSIHSLRWIKFFSERGHDVSWISFHPMAPEHRNSLNASYTEIASSQITLLRGMKSVFRTRRFLKQIKPDILHVHSVAFYGFVGGFTGFRPMVATAWGSDVLFAKNSIARRFVAKKILNNCEVVTCDARHMVDAIAGLGVLRENVRVINFGIDTQKFSVGPCDDRLRSRLNILADPVVLSTRNLLPIYDVGCLLEAVPIILKGCPTCRFIIAGSGHEEKTLKERVLSLNISNNVQFVGRLPNDQLPNYYRSATVYVSTALSDAGIAASTAEAMACGIPVVITDSGENREWVEDGQSGFVVPVKDPCVLGERVLRLLQNQDLRQRFADGGRKIIMERNDYQTEMSKMEKIYGQFARPFRS